MRTAIRIACAAWFCLLGSSLLARAVTPSDNSSPETELATKGLTRVGITWLLEDDVSLPQSLRAMRAAKVQVDQYTAKRRRIDAQIASANAAIAQWSAQFQETSQRLHKTSENDRYNYNALVTTVNALHQNVIRGGLAAIDLERERDALSDPQDAYVTAVVELSEKMEAMSKAYAALAADPEVERALSALNQNSRAKMRLGPSYSFTQELPRVRRLRGMILSAPVKLLVREEGSARVGVTLNGKATDLMVLDSGADQVCITWELAQKAGITPGPDDPTIKTRVAGGGEAEVKVVFLDTVQVGPFVAKHVECLVYPKSAKDADCLLGDSFLRQFVYKVNMKTGELRMSQMAGSSHTPSAGALLSEKRTDDPWKVIFRSDDPAQWNSAARDADAFAVPINSLPGNVRYLRMRNIDGDLVIIPITSAELRKNAMHPGQKWGWEGRNYGSGGAHHLGIYLPSLPRTQTGSVDVTQVPRAGYTGYGFGNRVNKDDGQGFVWAGKPIGRTIIEISVTSRDLSPADRRFLLSDALR